MFVLVLISAFIIYFYKRFASHYISSKWIVIFFVLKLLFSFAYQATYKYFYQYPSDSDAYIHDAIEIIDKADPSSLLKIVTATQSDKEVRMLIPNLTKWDKPFNYGLPNDNRAIIRGCVLTGMFIRPPIMVYYWVFSLISGLGILLCFASFRRMGFRIPFILFCLPSVLFWSSAPLKESLAIFFLGVMLFSLTVQGALPRFIFITLSIFGLATSRLFLMLSLMPASALFLFIHRNKITKRKVMILILVFLFLFIGDFLFIEKGLHAYILQKQHDFYNMLHSISGASSEIELIEVDNITSLFMLYSQALLNSLIRPFLWEAHNMAAMLASMENTAILLLLLNYIRESIVKQQRPSPIEISIIFFSVTAVCIAGASTPVLGALSRYRTPVLLLLIPVLSVPLYSKNRE